MSRPLIIILLIFVATSVKAQRVATGEVFAGNIHEPLPYATVMVITDNDSAIWAGTTTNDKGRYRIPLPLGKTVSLVVRMLGYKVSSPLSIPPGTEVAAIPPIFLEEELVVLGDVTVRADKPLFEILPDKLVVNVERSASFSGKSALYILQQTPGMVVNPNGTITANGKNGVSIMLNGRIIKLSPEMVGSFLEGLSANTIKKIEFVHSPDASQDADGEAGMINVVTSDAIEAGFHGSAFVNGGYGWKPKFGLGGNATFVSDKIQVAAQYSFNRNYTKTYWDNFFHFNDGGDAIFVESYNVREEKNADQSLTFQADYKATNKTTFGVNLIMNVRDHGYAPGEPSTVETELKRNGVTENYSSSTYAERNKWNRYIGNVNLRHQINNKASLSADFDYLYSLNNIPVLYSRSNEMPQPLYEPVMRTVKKTPITTYAMKIDHSYVVNEAISLSAGLRYTTNAFRNTLTVDSLVSDEWVRDESSSLYTYDENIAAGYISARITFPLKGELSAGMRYESTHMKIASSELVSNRRFNNFFPHLSFTKLLDPGRSLTATLSRRINRPSYWDLAPFAIFLGPNVFVAGNETLRPSLSNSATVTYAGKFLNLSANANLNTYTICNYQVRLVKERNMIAANAQNLTRSRSLHLTATVPGRQLLRVWETTNSVAIFGESLVADYAYLSRSETRALTGIRLSSSNTLSLPHSWKLEISGSYSSSTLVGVSKHLGFGTVSAGLGKQFKNTLINLNMSDMFWSWRWNRITLADDFTSEMKYLGEPRVVTLTLRRNFGNNRITSMKKRSTATEDELMRM
jgi:hypothetical protein